MYSLLYLRCIGKTLFLIHLVFSTFKKRMKEIWCKIPSTDNTEVSLCKKIISIMACQTTSFNVVHIALVRTTWCCSLLRQELRNEKVFIESFLYMSCSTEIVDPNNNGTYTIDIYSSLLNLQATNTFVLIMNSKIKITWNYKWSCNIKIT